MSSVNYTSEMFDAMGRDHLIELFDKHKIGIFCHIEMVGEIPVARFKPFLLSSFFRIVYHVKTVKPTSNRFLGDMYYYNYEDSIYRPNAETFFTEFIKDLWQDRYLSIPESDIFKDLRAATFVDREYFEFDPNYIAVSNCMIHLKHDSEWSYEILSNSPEYPVLSRIPTKYDPSASAPRFYQFLTEILPRQQNDIDLIQEYTGYCLYRAWIYDLALMFTGTGDNGKTTLIGAIRALLGPENTVEIDLYKISSGTWYSAELWQKLANLGDDISDADLKYTGMFKKITGGSRIMGERKFKDPFYFEPFAKHIWPANRLPNTPDDTDAFHRRWGHVEFGVSFEKDSRRDPQLLDKLTTPEELSGILNWALYGLIRLLNNNKFPGLPSVDERRKIWRSKTANAVVRYIYSDEIELGPEYLITQAQFIGGVNKFAVENNLPTMTATKIGRDISELFAGQIERERISYQGKQTPMYKGIRKTGVNLITDESEERVQEDIRGQFK